jgi:hypothetical protein
MSTKKRPAVEAGYVVISASAKIALVLPMFVIENTISYAPLSRHLLFQSANAGVGR